VSFAPRASRAGAGLPALCAGWGPSRLRGQGRPEAVAQRETIRDHLRTQLARLSRTLPDSTDQDQVRAILQGLAATDPATSTAARQAMTVLLGTHDAALFEAAETSQRGVLLAALLLALTIVAAGLLIVPMAWLYIRYKRGATIEVKV